MKTKHLMTCGFLFLAMQAAAQTKTTERMELGYPDRMALSIPKEFTYGHTPLLIMSNSSDRLSVYDENLELVKTMELGREHYFNYQLTYQDERREVSSVDRTELQEYDLGYSYSTFLNQNMNMDPTFSESHLRITKEENGDSTIVYTNASSPYVDLENMFFHYGYFGTQYPKRFWKCKGGKMYQCNAAYRINYTEWTIVGTRVEDQQERLRQLRLCNINLNQGDGRANYAFVMSQTLFNEDEEFEYIIPKYTLVSPESQSPDGATTSPIDSNEEAPLELQRTKVISEKSQLALIGFQVVSENGTVLNDLSFDDGFVASASPYYAFVVAIGSNTYLAFNGFVNNEACTVFYRINRSTSGIQKAKVAPSTMLLHPTIVERGGKIDLNLNDGNESGSEILVVAASGIPVQRMSIPSNQRYGTLNLTVPAGVYQVARVQEKHPAEVRKVIVK